MKLISLFENTDQYENLPYNSDESKVSVLGRKIKVLQKRYDILRHDFESNDPVFKQQIIEKRADINTKIKRLKSEQNAVKNTMDKYLKTVRVIRRTATSKADSYTYFKKIYGGRWKTVADWDRSSFVFAKDAKRARNFESTPADEQHLKDVFTKIQQAFPNNKFEIITMQARKR